MNRTIRRMVTGGVAVLAVAAGSLLTAQPGQAETRGSNETVRHGDYKAVFHHTGSKGETLEVFDYASDEDAAVAYVKFYRERPWPPIGSPVIDTDRLIADEGYRRFNLREGDSGSYDVPEEHPVQIMVCRGFKEIPGDNCSPWEWATA